MTIQSASVAVLPARRAFKSQVDGDEDQREVLDVGKSYDGSKLVFRLLRLETWGEALMNLGYRRFGGPLSILDLVTSLEFAQRPCLSR